MIMIIIIISRTKSKERMTDGWRLLRSQRTEKQSDLLLFTHTNQTFHQRNCVHVRLCEREVDIFLLSISSLSSLFRLDEFRHIIFVVIVIGILFDAST